MKDIKEITDRLEKGVDEVFASDNYRAYLGTMSKFYNYSFGNCLLIAMQKPDASFVAGFQAWKTKFKRTVKKGEKGIQILAPCVKKRTVEVTLSDGSTEEQERVQTFFRAAYVWDISQTEGEALPQLANKLTESVDGYDGLVEKLIKAAPVPVTFEDIPGSANGYFKPDEKRIAIQEGMSQAQTVKTLIHEIAHSILHNKETGTQKGADRRTAEVQAESVAYVVSNSLGVDSSGYSFGYIAGWSSGKEHDELKQSLQVIHDTAAEILRGLEAA